MEIIFATHNAHKAKEVQAILAGTGITIKTLSDIGYHAEIVEDGDTLDDNAWIKTHTLGAHLAPDTNIISDDTGLEVDALDGAPGVHSARFAGLHRSSADNMTKLLSLLEQTNDRGAQFRTVIAAVIDGAEYTFEGIVRGHITHELYGEGGFGYDPVFQPEGYDQTFGILPAEVKNEISHRGRAFAKLAKFLKGR